ncbi:putative hydrolase [Zafaria cholistanensis]|uniref:Putative hydrolase n=1 Tax=Zafaria cholistanensis TaxID=1682741 RepID=A0A5A7NRN0_9MICC|nr:carbon-nitrogen hydrolase family protein [Zafaria cholistanensis]GER23564.1 putative hydrolase [Zafaria cholistanensis]
MTHLHQSSSEQTIRTSQRNICASQRNICIVQSGGMAGDLAQDLERLLHLFAEAAAPGTGPRPDLVVFPELCNTPYFGATGNDAYKLWAEPLDGPTLTAFRQAAREHGTAVVLGFYEAGADGALYNSGAVIEADGTLVHGTGLDGRTVPAYRKTSIPQSLLADVPIDEKHFFAEGSGPAVFEVAGMRIAPLICYDRTFPEYWLGARALGADVVVPLVSSLGSREKLFLQELQVRALETQTWVLAANRGGPETLDGRTVDYFGLSCVVDPFGDLVDHLPAHHHDDLLRTDIDLDAVPQARAAFPLGRDRRPDLLEQAARRFAAEPVGAAALAGPALADSAALA